MNKPTIFLDIDGVLTFTEASMFLTGCVAPFMGRYNISDFDPTSLAILRRVIKLLDAEVVLTSTWGYGATRQEMYKLGATLGFTFAGKVRDDRVDSRAVFILEYLAEHPEITNYVIIDDEVKWYKGTVLEDKAVFVDEMFGINMQTVYGIDRILKTDLFRLSRIDSDRIVITKEQAQEEEPWTPVLFDKP